MRKFLALVAVITLLAPAATAQKSASNSPAFYNFKAIDFPGASLTQVFGINERGDVVGSYSDTDGNSHGFSLVNGRFSRIDYPGSVSTSARGINDDDIIVGVFTRADDPNGGHGYVLRGRTFSQVDFPGSAHSGILGVNEGGDITGSYDLGDINTGIGYFTENGRFVSFEVPNSAPQTTGPHGINDAGVVTGFFQDSVDPNVSHAFLKFRSQFTTVDYPGATITGFFGINERGDAVGGCTCVDGRGHGILYARGQFTFIVYPGADHTRPRAINDRGQIVGFFDVAGVTHGFIAIPVRKN